MLVCEPHYGYRSGGHNANSDYDGLQHNRSSSPKYRTADHQSCFNDLLCRHADLAFYEAMSKSAPNRVPNPIALDTPKSITFFVRGDAFAKS